MTIYTSPMRRRRHVLADRAFRLTPRYSLIQLLAVASGVGVALLLINALIQIQSIASGSLIGWWLVIVLAAAHGTLTAGDDGFPSLLSRATTKAVVRFPDLLLPIYAAVFDMESDKQRFLRLRLLRAGVKTLQRRMAGVGFDAPLLVEPKRTRVFAAGIFLDTAHTNRYMKVAPAKSKDVTAAVAVCDFLDSMGIEPQQIIDVGANVGEFALYFIRRYSAASVLAIEPSTENFEALKENISFNSQFLDMSRLLLVKKAVARSKGPTEMISGFRGEASIVVGDDNPKVQRYRRNGFRTETVAADTIDAIAVQHGWDQPDFVKIDIEGAEPQLLDGLLRLLPKSMFVEVSNISPVAGYIELLHGLVEAGYECYTSEGLSFADISEAERHLVGAVSTNIVGTDHKGTDLWFVRSMYGKENW